MKKRTVFVEFTGLPGVGKTTIAKFLTKELKSLNIPVKELNFGIGSNNEVKKHKKISIALIYMLKSPVFVLNLLYYIFKIKQQSIMDTVKVSYNLMFILGLYSKNKNNNKVNIMDQGLIQAIWAILYRSDIVEREVIIKRVLQLIMEKIYSENIFVIKVSSDTEVIIKRLRDRGRGSTRLYRDLKYSVDEYINKSQRAYALVENILLNIEEKNADLRVININNSNNIEEIQICKVINLINKVHSALQKQFNYN